MSGNPLPGQEARWGRFDVLQDSNRTILQNLLETASANKPTRSSLDQKMGDYYFACMDEKTIDSKGSDPLKAELAKIAGMTSKSDLSTMVAYLIRTGNAPFLRMSSEPDAKNSAIVILGADQGGLGLPDRDYYLKTDEKSDDIRKKYIEYLTRIFGLIGEPADKAAKDAQVEMTIETALAKGSLDRVSRRDPEKMYHKMTLAELQTLSPAIDWKVFLKELGAPPIENLDVAVPDYYKTLATVITDTSLADIKTYLNAVVVRDNAEVLAALFEQANFDFYRKVLSWHEGNAPALEALRGSGGQQPAGCAGTRVHREDAGRRRKAPQQRNAARHRKGDGEGYSVARLDDAEDQAASAFEAARGNEQDRRSGEVAGLRERQGRSGRCLREQYPHVSIRRVA